MAKIIAIGLVLVFVTTANAGYMDFTDSLHAGPDSLDDALHIGAGAVIAAGVGELVPDTWPVWSRYFLQLAVPIAAGFAKEAWWDKHDDYGEVWGYGAGAAFVITIDFGVSNYFD